MKNIYGLVETASGSVPRVYKLSHILADFWSGVRRKNISLQTVSVACGDVDDGKLDFDVPLRQIDVNKKSFITRIALAWEVFRGRADVLRYE